MRYAVCGANREGSVKKLESVLGVESIKPNYSTSHPIVDVAKMTYDQYSGKNVLFDGCAIDYLNDDLEDSLYALYEQITLDSLANIDKLFIVCDKKDEIYSYYATMMHRKIQIIKDETEIEL